MSSATITFKNAAAKIIALNFEEKRQDINIKSKQKTNQCPKKKVHHLLVTESEENDGKTAKDPSPIFFNLFRDFGSITRKLIFFLITCVEFCG